MKLSQGMSYQSATSPRSTAMDARPKIKNPKKNPQKEFTQIFCGLDFPESWMRSCEAKAADTQALEATEVVALSKAGCQKQALLLHDQSYPS